MTYSSDDIALVERSSNFTAGLLSSDEKWADESAHHAIHDSVLRPLLSVADECWAYGVEENSKVFKSAKAILTKEGRRHKVSLIGDPVTGHELFWNAHGGKRGTIVISVPSEKFDAPAIFPNCRRSFVFTNYRAGHSPGAITYAQRKIQNQTHVVFCLPRNNGLEWMEIFAPKPLVFELFSIAGKLCRESKT
jgi:hypothetical protein